MCVIVSCSIIVSVSFLSLSLCRFAIDMNRVPVFISRTLAHKILTSGKAVATVRLFQYLESVRLHQSAVFMGTQISSSQEMVTSASRHRKASGRDNSVLLCSPNAGTPMKEHSGIDKNVAVTDEALSDMEGKSDVRCF